ncbi:alpha/beta hydrolase domain-containing protein [Roseateles chitinivorans]|uniref:alpha/beta hydrolase domain-containing protein n=1 Tax=Roseateles chitinivorans TaxID=2917965 RepID=UPI003D66466D
MNKFLNALSMSTAGMIFLVSTPAHSAAGIIDNFQVISTVDAFNGATPPGAAGPYILITAIAHGKLDPLHPLNAGIVDIQNAARDSNGMVSYSTDVLILRPKSAANAVRVLYYDVVNRGNKLGLADFVGGDLVAGTPPPATFPSLVQKGYTVVWSGWQGGIAQSGDGLHGVLGTSFPVAKNSDGSDITGLTTEEFIGSGNTIRLTYKPASPSNFSEVKFLARQSWYNRDHRLGYNTSYATQVASWNYVTNADGSYSVHFTPPAVVPDERNVSVPADAGTIYTFVYRAKQPLLNGIGFAAVRDLVSYLKNLQADGQGHVSPLKDMMTARCVMTSCASNPTTNFDVAIAGGQSQSGRFLKDFLYQGFNADKFGKTVFDGMLPMISGGKRAWVNMRFSQPGATSTAHSEHWQPGDQFPFTYGVLTDRYSGSSDGILKKCQTNGTCPKILHIDSSLEWWQGRGSLVVTNDSGLDITQPANVRVYMVSGARHASGPGVRTGVNSLPSSTNACLLPLTNIKTATIWRGLLSKLVGWVTVGANPPASLHPTVAGGAVQMSPDQPGYTFPASVGSLRVPLGDAATPTIISAPTSATTTRSTRPITSRPTAKPNRSWTSPRDICSMSPNWTTAGTSWAAS